jgi:hypothetical protein
LEVAWISRRFVQSRWNHADSLNLSILNARSSMLQMAFYNKNLMEQINSLENTRNLAFSDTLWIDTIFTIGFTGYSLYWSCQDTLSFVIYLIII